MLQGSSSLIADFSHTILQMLQRSSSLMPISVALFHDFTNASRGSTSVIADFSRVILQMLQRSSSLIAEFSHTIPRFYKRSSSSLSLSLSLPISEAPFQDSTTASMIIILKHGGNKEWNPTQSAVFQVELKAIPRLLQDKRVDFLTV